MAKKDAKYSQVEIFSCHSISKGLSGECGFRSGYLHIPENLDQNVYA